MNFRRDNLNAFLFFLPVCQLLGHAAAVSVLMVALVVLITWLQFRGEKEKAEY